MDEIKKKVLTNLYIPSNTYWKQTPLKSTHFTGYLFFFREEMNLKIPKFHSVVDRVYSAIFMQAWGKSQLTIISEINI